MLCFLHRRTCRRLMLRLFATDTGAVKTADGYGRIQHANWINFIEITQSAQYATVFADQHILYLPVGDPGLTSLGIRFRIESSLLQTCKTLLRHLRSPPKSTKTSMTVFFFFMPRWDCFHQDERKSPGGWDRPVDSYLRSVRSSQTAIEGVSSNSSSSVSLSTTTTQHALGPVDSVGTSGDRGPHL